MAANKRTRKKPAPERWSSERVFVLAASGVAIGLHNVWQFAFTVGEFGGGAFLLVYVGFLLLLGLPLLMSEIMVGRLGRGSPIHAIKTLVDRTDSDPNWHLLGSLKTFTGILVLSYLSVIAGWTLAYVLRAAWGKFDGLTADGVNGLFTAFASDPEKQIFWHSLFMMMTMVVVARGVRHGFEPVVRKLVPALFVLLLILLLYASTTAGIGKALSQVFAIDFSSLGFKGILSAMAHAFFTLSLGFGALMMYGAYLPEDASITRASLAIIALDTLAGLMAAIVVTAILIAGDQLAVAGPLLVFQALPLALDVLPHSELVATLLFLFLGIAAWLTAIALVEPAMAWLTVAHQMTRFQAAIWCGLSAWALGIVTILSFNYWAFDFEFFGIKKHLGFFDMLQIVTSNFLLPLAGLLVALFAGWSLERGITGETLKIRSPYLYNTWLWLVRAIVPVLLVIIAVSVSRLF